MWLVDGSRKFEEVDQVLEGRLRGIEQLIYDSETLRIKYGIESDKVSGNLARMIAYSESLEEYDQLSTNCRARIDKLEAEYDEEKEALRQRVNPTKKKIKYNHEVTQIRKKYDQAILPFADRMRLSENISSLYLRKAAVDIFSFDEREGGATTIYQNLPGLVSHALATGQQTTADSGLCSFVDRLTEYMVSSQDSDLLSRCEYKSSSGPISRTADMNLLGNTLNQAVNLTSYEERSDEENMMLKIYDAHYRMLFNRAIALSAQAFQTEEEFPLTTLLIDSATCVAYQNNPVLIPHAAAYIDNRFASMLYSPELKSETDALNSRWIAVKKKSLQELNEIFLTLKPGEDIPPEQREFVSRKLQLIDRRTLTSDCERLELGLYTLGATVAQQGAEVPWGNFITPVKIISNHEDFWLRGEYSELNDQIDNLRLAIGGFISVPEPAPLEIDLHTALTYSMPDLYQHFIDMQPFMVHVPNVIDRKSALAEMKKATKRVPHDLRASSYAMKIYGQGFWGDIETGFAEELGSENNSLWYEILDNSIWFISPRGDRFLSQNDPELAERGVESILFNIDKAYPREHFVRIKFEDIEEPMELILNKQRQILLVAQDESTEEMLFRPLIMQSDQQLGLENLILKRLYAITSGLLGSGTPEEPLGKDRTGPDYEFKRAYYAILRHPRYHMQSPGALDHAELIKTIYGIDIFKETERRRKIGTLDPDHHLTFVKERTPDKIARNVLPNDLVFDPILVRIP